MNASTSRKAVHGHNVVGLCIILGYVVCKTLTVQEREDIKVGF